MNTYKRLIFTAIVPALFAIVSCSNENKDLSAFNDKTDKITVEYYKEDGATVIKGFQVVADTASEIVSMMGYFTNNEIDASTDCDKNGLIHFYQGENEIFTAEISIEGECSVYYYTVNDKNKSKAISETGKAYFSKYFETAASLN